MHLRATPLNADSIRVGAAHPAGHEMAERPEGGFRPTRASVGQLRPLNTCKQATERNTLTHSKALQRLANTCDRRAVCTGKESRNRRLKIRCGNGPYSQEDIPMKKTIFVTGVTRMYGGFVCVSGVDMQNGHFIRPEIHYPGRRGIKKEFLFDEGRLIIRPLSKVELEFVRPTPHAAFHTEDWQIDETVKPKLVAIPTDAEKQRLLSQHSDLSINRALADQGRSVVIVRPQDVPTFHIRVYDGKLKTHMEFRDQAGEFHSRLPVTDANWLGVVRYLWMNHRSDIQGRLRNALSGKELFLRIGITREWRGQIWRQVSGVFSIPDWLMGRSFADFGYNFVDDV